MADETQKRSIEDILIAIRYALNHSSGPDDMTPITDGELAVLCDGFDRLRSQLALKDKVLADVKLAADRILAHITMDLGRYLYDAPDTDLVPLMIEYGVSLTGKQFMNLYKATEYPKALSTNLTDAK